jgi:hypothetical protein
MRRGHSSMAKILGYQVATNTTVYKETEVQEIEDMFKFLSSLEVDGHTISPGYDYDAAKKDMVKRLGKDPKQFFLTRDMTRQKFAKIMDWGKALHHFWHAGLPGISRRQTRADLHRLGHSHLQCPGLEGPCYLMTDGHYPSYQELLDKVTWEKYGVVDGVARDPRCEHCMVHCGYDPSGALGTSYKPGDNWKNFKYNFGAKPNRSVYSLELEKRAFNGVSASAKAIWPKPRPPSIRPPPAPKAHFPIMPRCARNACRQHCCGTNEADEKSA